MQRRNTVKGHFKRYLWQHRIDPMSVIITLISYTHCFPRYAASFSGFQCLFLQLEDFSTVEGIDRIINELGTYFGNSWPIEKLEDLRSIFTEIPVINPSKKKQVSAEDILFTAEHRRLFKRRFDNDTLSVLGYPPDPFGEYVL